MQPADLADLLRGHRLLLHHSCALQLRFADFVARNSRLLKRGAVYVPPITKQVLQAKRQDADPRIVQAAFLAQDALDELSKSGRLRVLREDARTPWLEFAESLLNGPLLVLCNDPAVTLAVEELQLRRDWRRRHSLVYALVEPETGQVRWRPSWHAPRVETRWWRRAWRRLWPSADPCPPFANADRAVPQDVTGTPLPTLRPGDTVFAGRQRLVLGELLGDPGGEGSVFAVADTVWAAKILTEVRVNHEDKLRLLMTRRPGTSALCWPHAVLRDADRRFRGYLMPRAAGVPLGAHFLLDPYAFQRAHPLWTRRQTVRLAITILETIGRLHQLGIRLVDLKANNILVVDEHTVAFVDCDSYQVEGHACPVRTEGMTAPEVLAAKTGTALRTQEHELFAVATLLFQILIPGQYPYNCVKDSDRNAKVRADPDANVLAEGFPYPLRGQRAPRVPRTGPWLECWTHLSDELHALFHTTFRKGRRQKRCTVARWLRALYNYQAVLYDPSQVFLSPVQGFDLNILPRDVRFDEAPPAAPPTATPS